ncbi:two-component system chemotaxis response regulator CheB [Alicyclobacillus sacchari]|uniref:protein-glutamate methylesterase n=1 Tax=Alicyclobacillus sacchari TaxID=392010 RepID=A0A4R8LSN0_9BACL|nr:CheB methylesterase domain-containing protein [Alicyclobacillus sacchari]TDY50498.1 two-component system chemotaxis response regulator CheB [Alicyclobacillus sacchari]
MSSLILIGASTGGPKALTELFSRLPAIPGAACCVVQHMPAGFTYNLAKRLNDLCAWRVAEGADGVRIEAGAAYVAPGGCQMRIVESGTVLQMSVQKEVGGHLYHPSVDVMFVSAAALSNKIRLFGVILTGMGRDGAVGLKAIRERGGFTIAEGPETATIYGMPRAAWESGGAAVRLPLPEIPGCLIEQFHLANGG